MEIEGYFGDTIWIIAFIALLICIIEFLPRRIKFLFEQKLFFIILGLIGALTLFWLWYLKIPILHTFGLNDCQLDNLINTMMYKNNYGTIPTYLIYLLFKYVPKNYLFYGSIGVISISIVMLFGKMTIRFCVKLYWKYKMYKRQRAEDKLRREFQEMVKKFEKKDNTGV